MRLVKKMGLKKRGLFQEQTVREALVIELQTSGICLGYRAMARRLFSKYGIYTARSKVAVIMKELDPDGVRNRSKHKLTRRMYVNSGPNYLLHIDGYDKLKRFGFAIHGGMCGFSRRVLWLKVNKSNNNPKVVAGYFLQYLYDIKGVPRCVRTDKGTENVLIANIQRALRWDHLDDMSRERSFLTGSSPSNQRIERWWRSTKEGGIQFWIDFFKDKESEGIISTDNAQQLECLRFCFTQLLQEDLNQCRKEWNQHKIRQSRHAQAHGGRPDLMFFCPELYGAVNYKTDVDVADLDLLAEHCEFPTENGCSLEKEQEYKDILNINGREMPNNVQEAMNLYNMLIAYE